MLQTLNWELFRQPLRLCMLRYIIRCVATHCKATFFFFFFLNRTKRGRVIVPSHTDASLPVSDGTVPLFSTQQIGRSDCQVWNFTLLTHPSKRSLYWQASRLKWFEISHIRGELSCLKMTTRWYWIPRRQSSPLDCANKRAFLVIHGRFMPH